MKILLIHNFHRSGAPSGDDLVVKREMALLQDRGHAVRLFSKSNDDIDKWSIRRKLKLFVEIPWSKSAQLELEKILQIEKPDIVHIHNIFPQFSISIYESLIKYNFPFVHTLHDYRLFCANAFLFRNGANCELCPQQNNVYCLINACFQNSYIRSLSLYIMLENIKKKLCNLHPDFFITLTEFAKNKLIEFGISGKSIYVKPNFINEILNNNVNKGNYCAFVGRISTEKGISVLIKCFNELISSDIYLKIIGSGPLYIDLKNKILNGNDNIELLGLLEPKESIEYIQNAKFLIMPSLCYEGFPITLVEAMAAGTPAIASSIGAFKYLIENYKTGILFEPGNANDLAEKIKWLWEHDEDRRRMRENARKEYEEKYTPERNYKMLMDIYEKVIEMHRKKK